jgi:hypothetical protein
MTTEARSNQRSAFGRTKNMPTQSRVKAPGGRRMVRERGPYNLACGGRGSKSGPGLPQETRKGTKRRTRWMMQWDWTAKSPRPQEESGITKTRKNESSKTETGPARLASCFRPFGIS